MLQPMQLALGLRMLKIKVDQSSLLEATAIGESKERERAKPEVIYFANLQVFSPSMYRTRRRRPHCSPSRRPHLSRLLLSHVRRLPLPFSPDVVSQPGALFSYLQLCRVVFISVILASPSSDQNRNFVYFLNSASAEIFANLALCPFEAIKKAHEDSTVDFFYFWIKTFHVRGVPSYTGYAAGSVGSLISDPADNIVFALYNRKADSLMLAIRKIGFANLFTRSLRIRFLLFGPSITLQLFF
ncbi:hypothetical protein PIB30_051375 [Stylosanthes scabra]|uniref:Uncharacterized protein n=1 Tax=Stylosanthes scabra TaxID=79078 RepID=A0ABU6RIA2_9FABA|nr:hypothetical protein [Stylosanthes scabra]